MDSSSTNLPTTGLSIARSQFTTTSLVNGKVLIVGGATSPSTFTNTAELFDPATETFTLLNSTLVSGRADHCAVTMPSGLVLLIGGYQGHAFPSVDVFDPTANVFTSYPITT